MQADVDKARALVVLSVLAVAVLMATAAWMGAGDRRVLDRGRRSGSPAAAAPIRSGAGIDSRWWNARWPYRLPVSVGAAGYARENGTPVEVELDFADRLGQVDASGELDPQSIRVVEVAADDSTIIDENVPFQFDQFDARSRAATEACGTLTFLLEGQTPPEAVRYYHVYFGTGEGTFAAPNVPEKVGLEDIGTYEGFPTWKITTPRATYYYHKRSAGFASLIDQGGNDWISYHPEEGSGPEGEYRGIPNMSPMGFHPGNPEGKKKTQVLSRGPVKLSLLAETTDEQWRARWDLYPTHATMTLLSKGPEPYWILYEGTPGGRFDRSDYWVTSTGERFSVEPYTQQNKWTGDLPAPEWVYFGDAGMDRVMYYARHGDDNVVDRFWRFGEGEMTVFGFGRGPREVQWERLRAVPARLTVGFAEDNTFTHVRAIVRSATRPLDLVVGAPRARPDGAPSRGGSN